MESLEAEIFHFTESIWKNTLNLAVEKSEKKFQPGHLENTLASCVHISGRWQGTVTLHCPATLARKVAAIMFAQEEEETQIQEIQDALGELANMTGGNLKSLFPEPCYLSLPTVAVTNFDLRVPGSELISMVTLNCEGKRFTISILKKVSAHEPSKTESHAVSGK